MRNNVEEHRQRMAEENTEFKKAQGKPTQTSCFSSNAQQLHSVRMCRARAGFKNPFFVRLHLELGQKTQLSPC